MATVELKRPHLLGLEVIEGPLTIEEILSAVDAHISEEENVTGVRIVLSVIGVDGNTPVPDLDVIVCHRHPIFEPSITISRDLNRFVTKVPELGTGNTSQREHQGRKQKKTAHHKRSSRLG